MVDGADVVYPRASYRMILGIALAQLVFLAHSKVQETHFQLLESFPWRLTDRTGCAVFQEGVTYVGNDLNDGCKTTTPTFQDCCFFCSKFPQAIALSWHTEEYSLCPKGCWCKTRLEEARKITAPAVSAVISRGLHWLVPAHAFGVYHGWLPGVVTDPRLNEQAEGTLHLFARAAQDQGKYLVRGFAYFWSMRDLAERTQAKYRNPHAFAGWVPEVFAMCNNRPGMEPVKYKFEWLNPIAEANNAFFEGVIEASNSSNCRLHVNDWGSSWGLTAVLAAARRIRAEQQPLRVFTVFGQGYGNLDVADTERRMRVHIEYHRRLGFAGLWSYSREAGLELHELVANRYPDYMTAIHWGDFPVHETNNYDQSVMHNHALLGASWSNMYLYLTDLDEFLATDVPRSVNELVGSCICGKGVSMSLIPCLDILYVNNDQGGSRNVSLSTPDVEFWPREPTLEVLRSYSLLAHPVVKHVKGFVRPDDVVRYFIHGGDVRPGSLKEEVPLDCMYCVHMRNVVKVRRTDIESFHATTSWQWVLPGPEHSF